MRLKRRTRTRDIYALVPLMSDTAIDNAIEWAQSVTGRKYHTLTIAEAVRCAEGDFEAIGFDGDLLNSRAFEWFWVFGFVNVWMPEYLDTLEKMSVEPTADEKTAAESLIKSTWYETQVVFVQRYFGLKSFDEAERITLDQLMLCHKAQHNDMTFQRKILQIQKNKK